MLIRECQIIVKVANKYYRTHVCGLERVDGTWEGWLEFHSQGQSSIRITGQETSQPNFSALEYWADGLEPVYVEGAFERTKRLTKHSRKQKPKPSKEVLAMVRAAKDKKAALSR